MERAKSGDREAFGELARRHRDKMLGYARSITHEPFLAEDIVQEALIRAFFHMGTLVDMNRFMPWLHRIVRNQAYTKMNGASLVREQTFTAIRTFAHDGTEETDWSSLDSILGTLSRSASTAAAARDDDPEERFMRKQTVEMIEGMLRCLSRREREVFESHFFHHLAPEEIAKLFSVTPANVYQILSRSRKKLIQE
ncbi:RNA polymerase sigma factor [Paenibacillus mesophilus]|uniref:RNA polymerase sigma factor n=1 Tax=Paenibacillus mesophilus TaxID=2582849 RepID=UPI001EE3FF2C|nr:RNA polymerase sigma factor [Paenibacillus mesophilus]